MEDTQDSTDEGWTSALLIGPSGTTAVDGRCRELLEVGDVAEASVLLVAYAALPDRRLARWESHVGDRPSHLEIVSVGDSPRSLSAASRGEIRSPRGDVTVSYVQPGDLIGLGIRISERLAEYNRNSTDGSSQFLLCLDSLSALLQHVELERAFRFVHVLTGRLRGEGARAHFHLDPATHDEQTVAVLTSLFDVVIDAAEE